MYKRIHIPVGTFKTQPKDFSRFLWGREPSMLAAVKPDSHEGGRKRRDTEDTVFEEAGSGRKMFGKKIRSINCLAVNLVSHPTAIHLSRD